MTLGDLLVKKIEISQLTVNGLTKIFEGDKSTVYKTKGGEIFKSFSSNYLQFLNSGGVDLEKIILESKPIEGVPEIVVPNKAVYFGDSFLGYTADFIEGVNLNVYLNSLSLGQKYDLDGYASLYKDIEDVVKEAENIVFPDLCTLTNLMVTDKGFIRFIDYDGMQVGGRKSACISTMLGEQTQYFNDKYLDGDVYTKELDKKSLIMLYFITTFNVDLNYVGSVNNITGQIITLDDIFSQIGLDDDEIKHKVWKCFQKDGENDYLGDDVYRIAQEYNMNIYLHPTRKNTLIKILKKKD